MANYQVVGPLLVVTGELQDAFDLNFDISVADLLASAGEQLTIDMCGVSYIGSSYIGKLVALAKSAQDRGKTLIVVAPDGIADTLEVAGVAQVLQIDRC